MRTAIFAYIFAYYHIFMIVFDVYTMKTLIIIINNKHKYHDNTR